MYSVVLMVALTTGGETPDFHHRGGGGCCGCYGGGCSGCYGGGWGYGGCCGCYGGYYGGGWGGCYGGGCYGGCYGGGWGGGGYYGGWAYYGGGYGYVVSRGGSTIPSSSAKVATKEVSTPVSAPATIVVSLPEDAKLKVGEYVTKSTSATRTLQSPSLPAGQAFSYTLQMEVVRDGKTVTLSKEVTVRAGQTTTVEFSPSAVAMARK
jgi:uncharacterized protein (TIGR03000 family)